MTPNIDNLYALATHPNLEKKLHHRYVPMMMYSKDNKEVVLPMVVGSSRELADAEAQAEKDTRAQLGDVALINRGKGSTWNKVMDMHRSGWILYYCTRMPGKLTDKFFETKEQVMDTYDADELGILMDHYATVRYTQPHYLLLDGAEDPKVAFQKVIDKIKQQGEDSDFFLNSLTTHTVNQLIKFLVSPPTNSESINGGSGMPSSNTEPTEIDPTPKSPETK